MEREISWQVTVQSIRRSDGNERIMTSDRKRVTKMEAGTVWIFKIVAAYFFY